MRFFNVAGPVRPDKHYAIQPLDRVDVDELLTLIRAERYFVLHAPRQTGKTSAFIALRDFPNSGEVGRFRCVNVNVEPAQVARDDVARGVRAVHRRLHQSIGPLRGRRTAERNAAIAAAADKGDESYTEIGRRYGPSRQRSGAIVAAERRESR